MHRSQLETKYRKQPTDINSERYRKQKNFCSKLYKKERKKYYSNLDLKQFTDNKPFWQNIEPFLSDKNEFSNCSVTIKSFLMILKLLENLTSSLKTQLII